MAGTSGENDAEIRKAIEVVARLNDELTKAYLAGDGQEVERLLAEIAAAERRRNRLIQRYTVESAPATLPIREQVARVLGLLQRPAAVSLIRDVAAARFGDNIPGPRLASLRRDEHRSWTAATTEGGQRAVSRPVYVVPGLTYDRFGPMRGVLALSSFPLEVRLIAPASPRVDMLHMIDKLAQEVEHSPDAPWAIDVRRLLWRLGRTVPEGEGAGPADLRRAVAAELSQVDATDAAERATAKKRALKQLNEEQQLFGTRFEQVVGAKANEA